MKHNSLWFLDSELKDDSGHYANFAGKIIEEARHQKLETIVAGNRMVNDSIVERLGVRKAFHGMTHSFVPLGKAGAAFNPLIGSRVHYRRTAAPQLRLRQQQITVTFPHSQNGSIISLTEPLRLFWST